MKIAHNQGRSPNVVSHFPYHKELLLKERILKDKFLPLREDPILKRGAKLQKWFYGVGVLNSKKKNVPESK